MFIIIQLIFLQQYFPIPVLCNITRYCTGVIARAQVASSPGSLLKKRGEERAW